jgi:hypothetical protein
MTDYKEQEEMDALTIGEIRSDMAQGDWEGAYYRATEELWSETLRDIQLAEIVRRFGVIDCPCCQGKGGWSGQDWRGYDFDVDCEVCEGMGVTTQKRVDEVEEEERRQQEEPEAWQALHGQY